MSLTTLDPRSALIVIDLQQLVMGLSCAPHATGDVLARTVRIADAFRARSLPVVLVRTTGEPGGRTDLGRSRPAGSTPPEGWDVLDSALTTGEHHVVTKQAWGAFSGTGLHDHLRQHGVTQVVLTGIATSLGVESTARTAHEHGYHVTLVTDAVSDRDPARHESSVSHIFPRLAETGTTAELLNLLP